MKLDLEQLRELIRLLDESNLTEIEVEHDDDRIRIRRDPVAAPVAVPAQAPASHAAGAPAANAVLVHLGNATGVSVIADVRIGPPIADADFGATLGR